MHCHVCNCEFQPHLSCQVMRQVMPETSVSNCRASVSRTSRTGYMWRSPSLEMGPEVQQSPRAPAQSASQRPFWPRGLQPHLAQSHHSPLQIRKRQSCSCRSIILPPATSQRIALMRLAHACATVVQTQDRLVSAATVLQKAWRQVLDTRIRKLNDKVVLFQGVAKGWLQRRKIQRQRPVATFGGQVTRVMGGW